MTPQTASHAGQGFFDQTAGPVGSEFALGGGHLFRRGRGIDEHRTRRHPLGRPGNQLLNPLPTVRQTQRVHFERRTAGSHVRHLPAGGHRAAPGQDGRRPRRPIDGHQSLGCGQPSGRTVIPGQPHGHRRSSGHQGQISAGAADGRQMPIVQCVHHHIGNARALEARQLTADLRSPLLDDRVSDRPHGSLAAQLAAQKSYEIGIGHGGQGMVAHARFGQQALRHEKMPLIDGPSIGRKGRTENGDAAAGGFS